MRIIIREYDGKGENIMISWSTEPTPGCFESNIRFKKAFTKMMVMAMVMVIAMMMMMYLHKRGIVFYDSSEFRTTFQACLRYNR